MFKPVPICYIVYPTLTHTPYLPAYFAHICHVMELPSIAPLFIHRTDGIRNVKQTRKQAL